MIKSVFRYILSREVYRLYSKNKERVFSWNFFERLGILCWRIIFIAIAAILSIGYVSDMGLNGPYILHLEWWVYFGMTLLLYFSIISLFRTLFRYLNKTLPVYEEQPVFKTDKRFRTGVREDGFKLVFVRNENMTDEQLELHRGQQLSRLMIYFLLLVVSIIYLLNKSQFL